MFNFCKRKPHYQIRPVVIRRKHYWLEIIIIISVLLLVAYIDTQVARAKEQVLQAQLNLQFVECLNGQARWWTEDGGEVGCYKAEVNH